MSKKPRSLVATHRKVAARWHPTRNGELRPKDVTAGSSRMVWWKGSCGHVWAANVFNRANATYPSLCPACAMRRGHGLALAVADPALAAQWHPTRNGKLTPRMVGAGSNHRAWWKGHCGHVWQTKVYVRAKNRAGCPRCARRAFGLRAEPLSVTHPGLAGEWMPRKNKIAADQVVAGSHMLAWWRCERRHTYQAMVKGRSQGRGCPVCWAQRRRAASSVVVG